ncbi:MAG TPA: TetR family transcriptional regulator [Acidimicrobiia bacterium]|nr:TetR family transcriptional regulator [Acidimicrobiia bacterium]
MDDPAVTTQDGPRPGNELRERRRLRMAATIERSALELFAERGFAAVTVNDIAAAVDISRRTFFRYFASKESVLFGDPQREENRLVSELEQRPEEGPVEALHAALIEMAREQEADPTITALRLRVLESAPEITSAAFAQRITFQRRLTPLVAQLMGVDEARDMRPDLVVSVSMSAMYVGLQRWLANGAREPLHELVSSALEQAAAGLTATVARRAPTRAVSSR